jgi:hypothetical protein
MSCAPKSGNVRYACFLPTATDGQGKSPGTNFTPINSKMKICHIKNRRQMPYLERGYRKQQPVTAYCRYPQII